MRLLKIKLILLTLLLCAFDSRYLETRCCVTPNRDLSGKIVRDASVIYYFKKAHPCPVTGLKTGACPNWSVDHVIPLACGGVDAVSNMAWMPNAIKSGSGTLPKDRWERKVYCAPQELVF
jgi:hypothetical protein